MQHKEKVAKIDALMKVGAIATYWIVLTKRNEEEQSRGTLLNK